MHQIVEEICYALISIISSFCKKKEICSNYSVEQKQNQLAISTNEVHGRKVTQVNKHI